MKNRTIKQKLTFSDTNREKRPVRLFGDNLLKFTIIAKTLYRVRTVNTRNYIYSVQRTFGALSSVYILRCNNY